ncbi:hypothetical protein BJ166DRAFT_606619 [Pestalotiopsis sp. NC0098]|nr:hypothetical protein BJ166DRAFT_606619 [Pestalotiopsis sp. NC0098]
MATDGGYAALAPESDTLAPLPNDHRTGLTVAGSAALISFLSTTGLFVFLAYKLLAGLVARWYEPRRSYGNDSKSDSAAKKRARNPFPLLIFNLLLAEMHTALGYTLNLQWVVRDGIFVGTTTCWAQGWLNNIGVLSSSIFFVSISINTYLSVVRGYRAPQWFIYSWIGFCWLLTFVLTAAGIIATHNGRDAGGWYVRANTWCWVNSHYGSARLWAEWAWILASIPTTIILYTVVFWSLWHDKRSSRHLPRGRMLAPHEPNLPSGHHPAFLIYPFIYIACTSPLAVARLITVSGGNPSVIYYCISGLMLGTNGFWNTLLWSTTMLFSTPEDMRNTGLDQFTFVRTPLERQFGNIVTIEGPATRRNHAAKPAGWWWWNLGGQTRWPQSRNTSQQSLRRETRAPAAAAPERGIQMDVITTIDYDDAGDHDHKTTFTTVSASSMMDKESGEHDRHNGMYRTSTNVSGRGTMRSVGSQTYQL